MRLVQLTFALTLAFAFFTFSAQGSDKKRQFSPWDSISSRSDFDQFDISHMFDPSRIPGVTIGMSQNPFGRDGFENWNEGSDEDVPSGGNDLPAKSTGDFASAALQETNKYRAMHGAAPLTLDPELSADAQKWADQLAASGQMQHSCSKCSDYGENLWMMGGMISDPVQSAKEAVKSWYDEVNMYNWNNPAFSMQTGHFTALVWKGTTQMGIGLATNQGSRSTYVVARYVPAGNRRGAFRQNVGQLQ